MTVLLIGTYDLGRQPFGLASPAAWLRRAGVTVAVADLSRGALPMGAAAEADLVAFYLPMHTATRLALPVMDRVRVANPTATLCAFGLYAPLNRSLLEAHGVSVVLGPEAEADLVALASTSPRLRTLAPPHFDTSAPLIPRLAFIQPDRTGLPPLTRYASLQMPDGTRRIAGATDATRGCKHRCRHCPIVPVYDGQFRVVPVEVVLADVRALVEQGAEHITFGDPDFFNGPAHATRIVDALHAAFPAVTFDVTIKVEHLLAHRDLLPALVRSGCLFVTSAVESVDDEVLARLDKGHTGADFVEAARLCRAAGLTLAPTFVAFTPWTTVESYSGLLDVVEELDLVGHVAPIQWGIRLLVTWQSRLLELADIHDVIGPFEQRTLTYPWRHRDPLVDDLHLRVMRAIGARVTRPRSETFSAIRRLVDAAGAARSVDPRASREPLLSRSAIPYLNEPWYC